MFIRSFCLGKRLCGRRIGPCATGLPLHDERAVRASCIFAQSFRMSELFARCARIDVILARCARIDSILAQTYSYQLGFRPAKLFRPSFSVCGDRIGSVHHPAKLHWLLFFRSRRSCQPGFLPDRRCCASGITARGWRLILLLGSNGQIRSSRGRDNIHMRVPPLHRPSAPPRPARRPAPRVAPPCALSCAFTALRRLFALACAIAVRLRACTQSGGGAAWTVRFPARRR